MHFVERWILFEASDQGCRFRREAIDLPVTSCAAKCGEVCSRREPSGQPCEASQRIQPFGFDGGHRPRLLSEDVSLTLESQRPFGGWSESGALGL
jgi:hypothetical protein